MSEDTDKKGPRSPSSTNSPPDSVELLDPSSESSSDDNEHPQEEQPKAVATVIAPTKHANPFELVPCILSGIIAKRSPFRIDSWIDCVLTLDGRDKITKFFQYTARLLAWYYMGTAQEERFASLKKSLVNSRKAYRLGRSVIELHRLKQLQTQKKGEKILSGFGLSNALEKLLNSVRLLGLATYWCMDNTAFLAASGLWDNVRLDSKARASNRKTMQTRVGALANRSYFVGAVAGFFVNWKALRSFRMDNSLEDKSPEDRKKLQAKYFGLCVALLKSVCDVLVFSNNPGLDLWERYRGRKLDELIHCIAGLTSASVVLYKNFPEA